MAALRLNYISAILVFAVTLFSATFATAEKSDLKPQVIFETLDNGLQVVIIPDRRAPVVTHMVWYKVGSADEPIGKSGIAHYLEHLMFKRTSNVPEGEFSRRVAEIGGQENAFTSADYTAYYQKVPSADLEMVMRYESDRMANLNLVEDDIATERDVVLEERNQRFGSNPAAKLGQEMSSAMFRHHPYGTPVIGWESEIKALSLEDAVSFYDTFYTPNNATLVVAGDVEPARVLELATATYGKLEQRAEPGERIRVAEPPAFSEKVLTHRDKQVTTPSWRRSYRTRSYYNGQGLEAEALDLLAAILGGSATSRIRTRLINGREILTSGGAFYSGSAVDDGTFGFYASPRGETTIEEVQAAIDELVSEVLQSGVTQEELDRARNALLKTTIYDRDSQALLARIYGTVLTLGGTVEDIAKWPERISQVSVEDVNSAARKYLKREGSVTGFLLPEVTN